VHPNVKGGGGKRYALRGREKEERVTGSGAEGEGGREVGEGGKRIRCLNLQ